MTQGNGQEHITAGIRLLARLARVAERSCQGSSISLPQYRLLVSISGQSRRAGELADQVDVSRPTLTSLVDGLEQNGLLKRVPVASDRRGIQLVPTQAGLEAIVRAENVLYERFAQIVDRELVDTVGQALTTIGAALDREEDVPVARQA